MAGGIGPHYYQELYVSPHKEGRIYLADVRIQVSEDHGKTFRRLKELNKHSDNHSMNFIASDPDYLLIGTDGGVYESFDLAENWRFMGVPRAGTMRGTYLPCRITAPLPSLCLS